MIGQITTAGEVTGMQVQVIVEGYASQNSGASFRSRHTLLNCLWMDAPIRQLQLRCTAAMMTDLASTAERNAREVQITP